MPDADEELLLGVLGIPEADEELLLEGMLGILAEEELLLEGILGILADDEEELLALGMDGADDDEDDDEEEALGIWLDDDDCWLVDSQPASTRATAAIPSICFT